MNTVNRVVGLEGGGPWRWSNATVASSQAGAYFTPGLYTSLVY